MRWAATREVPAAASKVRMVRRLQGVAQAESHRTALRAVVFVRVDRAGAHQAIAQRNARPTAGDAVEQLRREGSAQAKADFGRVPGRVRGVEAGGRFVQRVAEIMIRGGNEPVAIKNTQRGGGIQIAGKAGGEAGLRDARRGIDALHRGVRSLSVAVLARRAVAAQRFQFHAEAGGGPDAASQHHRAGVEIAGGVAAHGHGGRALAGGNGIFIRREGQRAVAGAA